MKKQWGFSDDEEDDMSLDDEPVEEFNMMEQIKRQTKEIERRKRKEMAARGEDMDHKGMKPPQKSPS